MNGGGGSGPAPQDHSVWLLGNTHPNADRSVRWDDDPFPYLGDPDALVVDLTTLTGPELEKIGKTKLDRAGQLIRDKLFSRGTVVAITQPLLQIDPDRPRGADRTALDAPRYAPNPNAYTNYQVFPVKLTTRDVPDGGTILVGPDHAFREYVEHIRKFSFYIERYTPRDILDVSKRSANTASAAASGQEIRDNSGHDLGLTLAIVYTGDHPAKPPHEGAGRLVFLPPPTEPIDDAIGRILSALGKVAPRAEPLPAWAERMTLGRAGEYKEKTARLREDMAGIQGRIDDLERTTGEILAHRRLLYAKGPELEDAAVRAFRILGFDDIEPMGGADEEDAAFEMGGDTPYSHGIIEAKGADRGIQMQHILQCNRWTDRRAIAGGRPSKGILVANQHRLKPYPESSEIRARIEPNQMEQARLKDICIIPSCALFEAVRRVLDGEEPDRAKTAARIAAAKGVLEDIL